jgi:hypothetical protein
VVKEEKTVALLIARILKEESMAAIYNYGQTDTQETAFFAAGTSQHPRGGVGVRGNSQRESRGRFGTRGGNHHQLPPKKPKLECSH